MFNIETWKVLHKDNRYFATHADYKGLPTNPDGIEGLQYLDMIPEYNILDIGCGYGRLLIHLHGVSSFAMGIDIAPEPLQAAFSLMREKASNGNWELFKGDGTSFHPITNASIDRAISVNVFQHIPRKLARLLIIDLRRILRSYGKAALQFLSGARTFVEIDLDNPVEQSIQYSNRQLYELVENTGMHIDQIVTVPINSDLEYKWLILSKEVS